MSRNTPGFFFTMRVLSGIVGLAIPILLARSMSVGGFAAYATIGATAALAVAVSSLGVDRACLRFLPSFVGKASLSGTARFLLALSLPRLLALAIAVIGLLWSGLGLPRSVMGSIGEASTAMTLIVGLGLTNAVGQLTSNFMQGLLLHDTYVLTTFGTLLARVLALIVFLQVDGFLEYGLVIWIFIATELAGSVAQLAFMLKNAGHRTSQADDFAMPSFKEVWSVSRANYVAYLVGIPWQASTLILLVSHYSSREMTAAFAFFQTLADRGRSFLPVQMLQGYVEPVWARLYAKDQRVNRFREPATLLLQSNHFFVALGMAIVIAIGEPALRSLTKVEYAEHYFLLLLLLVQVGVSSYSGMLWIGMNATNQSERLASAYLMAALPFAVLLVPLAMLAGAPAVIFASYCPTIALFLILRYLYRGPFANLALGFIKTAQLYAIGVLSGLAGMYVLLQQTGATGRSLLAGASTASICFLIACLVTLRLNKSQKFLVKHFIHGTVR